MATASERIREARESALKLRCYCPDDCNCHYPWRTNFCGCKAHPKVDARGMSWAS